MDWSRVSVERTAEDGLSGTLWGFALLRKVLVVDSYMEFTRPSKRHKRRSTRQWSRLGDRSASSIKREDVPPVPADVKEEAARNYLAQIAKEIRVADAAEGR